MFVGVKFINPADGHVLWTNYSKDGQAWLRKDMALSAAEKDRRSRAAMSQQLALTDSAVSSSMPSAAMCQQSAAFDDAASTYMPSAAMSLQYDIVD